MKVRPIQPSSKGWILTLSPILTRILSLTPILTQIPAIRRSAPLHSMPMAAQYPVNPKQCLKARQSASCRRLHGRATVSTAGFPLRKAVRKYQSLPKPQTLWLFTPNGRRRHRKRPQKGQPFPMALSSTALLNPLHPKSRRVWYLSSGQRKRRNKPLYQQP